MSTIVADEGRGKLLTKNNAAVPGYKSSKESKDGDVWPDLLEDPHRVADYGNGDTEEAE